MDKSTVIIPKGTNLNGNGLGLSIKPHNEILRSLLNTLQEVNFKELAGIKDPEKQPNTTHYYVLTVSLVLAQAKRFKWNLCRNQGFVYLYNGAFWRRLEDEKLKVFLGKAAAKLGVNPIKAEDHKFRDNLFKQFMATAYLPKPEQPKDMVLINLKNGTFEITPRGTRLREFSPSDFLTYQLQFEYDTQAKSPLFASYLDKVLPDRTRQYVLSEYLGYVFVRNHTLKLEAALFLYGTGANGKSVFYEIVQALLGKENTTNYTLQDLTNENGYHRAMIADVLVNYASEISGRLQSGMFKQLVSGETVSARLPRRDPIEITNYARLIFNINELPKDTEQTNAFFRRFLIVPFDVTIPEAEQDRELHTKIINSELSGVFNWVLQGLDRLLTQRRFSECSAVDEMRECYKLESDTVKLFLQEEQYSPSANNTRPLKEIYSEYKDFCLDNGYIKCGMRVFSDRLKGAGYHKERQNTGNVIWIEKKTSYVPALSTLPTRGS
ncbi:DNA primase family protein [Pontibacter roseus]|uniref:DNA primase family protein n=1 Tax=Pontibacter roseus TaxID=336989 RepID=UPI0003780D79|nr:phage/plasmid primase, P4 family [Pontibacter roseus]